MRWSVTAKNKRDAKSAKAIETVLNEPIPRDLADVVCVMIRLEMLLFGRITEKRKKVIEKMFREHAEQAQIQETK